METRPSGHAPFDLVVLLEDEWLLRPLLDGFLSGEGTPALLLTPTGRHAVRDFAAIFAARAAHLRRPSWFGAGRSWALLGPAREPGDVAADTAEELLAWPSPDADEARLRLLAERCVWALVPWYGTYQEGSLAFVSGDAATAQRFAACVERSDRVEVPGHGTHRRDLLLTRAAGVARLADATRFVLFDDEWFEGRLAWQMAQEEGRLPLLLAEQTEAMRSWWRRAERRLELLAETTVQERPYGPVRRAVYRSLDVRSFEAVVFRGGWQGALPDAILPGDTEPRAALEAVASYARCDPQLVPIEGLRELERLAACAGWAQGYSYGGGAEEHHAVFCARDAHVAARCWNLAGAVGPDREDRRIGRL